LNAVLDFFLVNWGNDGLFIYRKHGEEKGFRVGEGRMCLVLDLLNL
jgi:hypothetical protein